MLCTLGMLGVPAKGHLSCCRPYLPHTVGGAFVLPEVNYTLSPWPSTACSRGASGGAGDPVLELAVAAARQQGEWAALW